MQIGTDLGCRNRMSLAPAFFENSIPVVFAANNSFVPIFAACFQSLLDHAGTARNYDVILLHTDVTEENQALLLGLIGERPHISLRFFDVSGLVQEYDLKANAHISVETYFRFLIQGVLPDYDKVLYLDCDLIINADVAALYDIDVTGYLLAAALDPGIAGHLHMPADDTERYLRQELKMADPSRYFQAGVLLLNTRQLRSRYTIDQWLTFASVPYRFNDQDVLNRYCEGQVKDLDMRWNLLHDCDHTRVSRIICHAPRQVQEAYAAAHAEPKIIHYAGYRKPWQKPTEDLARYFWEPLRKTPYYEEVLYSMTRFAAKECILEDRKSRSLCWRFLRLVKKNLFRK